MRKLFIMLFALLLLIPLVNGCGSKNEADDSLPSSDEQATNENNNSLEAKITLMLAQEREPGSIIVRFSDPLPIEVAYAIFSSHGFAPESIKPTEYDPHMFKLYFSEDKRDIESVLREFLLDSRFSIVSTDIIVRPNGYMPD